MSMPPTGFGKHLLFSTSVFLIGCTGIASVIGVSGSSLALLTNPLTQGTPTPTSVRYWDHVEIAKPTYTALPSPTNQPTLEPTASPEPNIVAEIIQDTPTPENPGAFIEQPFSTSNATIAEYDGNKSILVDISEQHMYVYEADQLAYSFVASTGMNNATRTGNFSVLNKIPNAYGATWNIWMPNWLGIYWAGNLQNGIHALPILPNGGQLWAGYLGTPISYGCVVIGAYESQVLFNWAEIGTPVVIQW